MNKICISLTLCLSFAAMGKQAEPPLEISVQMTVDSVLSQSRSIRKAANELKYAKADVRHKTAAFFPTLNANIATGTSKDKQMLPGDVAHPKVNRDHNKYSGTVTLKQSLFAGFADLNAHNAAKAKLSLSEAKQKKAIHDELKSALDLFFQLELKQAELKAEQDALRLRQNRLQDTESRFRAGRETKLDVLKAKYAIKSQIPLINTIEADIAKLTLKFARAVGLPLDTPFVIKPTLFDADSILTNVDLPDIADAYRQALEKNPDLLSNSINIEVQKFDLNSAEKQHYPNVDFVAKAGSNTHLKSEIGSPDTVTYSGELQVNIPIFSGLSSFASKRMKLLAIQNLREDLSAKREEILDSLNSSYKNFQVANDKIVAEKVNIELARETIKTTESLFKGGKATMTDVLDSYSQAVTVQKSLAKAIYDKVVSFIEIKVLMGNKPL